MKVVLLQDLTGQGKAGEIREVRKGYAKNFLLPRGLALVATAAVIKQVESRLEKEKLEESIDREKLVGLAQQIEGKEIRLKARMGAGERLFGSVTAADVAEELGRSLGSAIDKKNIDMEEPFRQIGSYEVTVKLASDIKPKITLVIEEEEKEIVTEPREEQKQEKKREKKPKAKEKEKDKELETEQKTEKKKGKRKKEEEKAEDKEKEKGKEEEKE